MSSPLAPDEFAVLREVHEGEKWIGGKLSQLELHAEHTVEADVVLRILNLAATSELERD